MNSPLTVLLGYPSASEVEVRQVCSGHSRSVTGVVSTNENKFRAVAYVLEDPYSSRARWRKGDVLVAGSVRAGQSYRRTIWRYRPSSRKHMPYSATVLCQEAEKPRFKGIGLDPYGRLYYSDAGRARKVRQLLPASGGRFVTMSFATIPGRCLWDGDFAFDPDGTLYFSTGGKLEPGRIYKTEARAEAPETGRGVLRPIRDTLRRGVIRVVRRVMPRERGLATATAHAAAEGHIHGFSFHDCDRVVYTDDSDRFSVAGIDASLGTERILVAGRPVFQPPPDVVTPETHSPPDLDKSWSFSDVAVTRLCLEEYLRAHPNVRDAIQWRIPPLGDVSYDDWEDNPHTQGFQRMLRRMYARICCDRPVKFSYQDETHPGTGEPRIGPAVSGPDHNRICKRDAAEIYLAHLAHHLWVEVSQQVSWRLHETEISELKFLLHGLYMFFVPAEYPDGSLYEINHRFTGRAMPTDPVRAYRFLKGTDPAIREGESFIKDTLRESIFALSRWMRDHLRHGPVPPLGQQARDHYGYDGNPPLETMYLPAINISDEDAGARYWSWHGCYSAAPLVVILMRLLNIPAQHLMQYQWPVGAAETGWHGGMDFPTEELALWHSDDLYATGYVKDPDIEPGAVYNEGVGEYSTYLTLFSYQPQSAAESTEQYVEWKKVLGRIAVRNATHYIFNYFWNSVLYNPGQESPDDCYHPDKLQPIKQKIASEWGFTDEEAAQLLCENEQKFRDKIADFETEHSAEIAALAASEGKTEDKAAFDLYLQKHGEWQANR